MKKEKHIVMCVGLTHSGKTTFSKKLTKKHPDMVLIDNDAIATFINKNYPAVSFSEYNKIKRNFKEPNFKFLLFKAILDFALRTGINIVLSNGNLGKDIRNLVITLAKKYSYKVTIIYFDLSRQVIKERIAKTGKGTSSFLRSKKWEDVLTKQVQYAELPPSKAQAAYYFEIKRASDTKKVLSELDTLLLCESSQ
jgi:predicted kinase